MKEHYFFILAIQDHPALADVKYQNSLIRVKLLKGVSGFQPMTVGGTKSYTQFAPLPNANLFSDLFQLDTHP